MGFGLDTIPRSTETFFDRIYRWTVKPREYVTDLYHVGTSTRSRSVSLFLIFVTSDDMLFYARVVVGCVRLKDTEWISKQDPYVSIEYGSSRPRTRTCTGILKNFPVLGELVFPFRAHSRVDRLTIPMKVMHLIMCVDGGKNPTFQEKFVLTLIEGLRELTVSVWNSNTLSADDFIGNGRYL